MHVIKYTEKLEISVKKYEREMEMHLEVYEQQGWKQRKSNIITFVVWETWL